MRFSKRAAGGEMAAEMNLLNGPRRAGRTVSRKGPRKIVRFCGGGERNEAGRARVSFDGQVSADGLFPRYQGKACVSTPPSGRVFSANLGGTAEVSRLLSQRNHFGSFRGMEVFF